MVLTRAGVRSLVLCFHAHFNAFGYFSYHHVKNIDFFQFPKRTLLKVFN
jgi:hypothetical protein